MKLIHLNKVIIIMSNDDVVYNIFKIKIINNKKK